MVARSAVPGGRTSFNHPLLIATVPTSGGGALGLTLCPGKKDRCALTGAWDRDLETDLASIHAWGAAAVVTLVHDDELEQLAVPGLGAAVEALGMAWVHLPIVDVAVPDAAFEQAWRVHGPMFRDLLRAGRRLLVHCRGGLGRAGMVAARLLVELGTDPEKAIRVVREARPGAIETDEQAAYVRASEPAVDEPGVSAEARATGALLGLAVGDALGTTLEFRPRDSYPHIEDIVGGGPFRLEPGQWTDDTSMALCLADSLLADGGLDQRDLMARFVRWWQRGERSATGCCFDIGNTTRAALQRFIETGDPVSGSRDPSTGGNGSLMRLAPVAIRWHADSAFAAEAARRQSEVTHGAAEALEACVFFAELLVEAIDGAPKGVLFLPRGVDAGPAVAAIARGTWRHKQRAEIRSSGYVVHTLEAALWCVYRSTSFREAVLLAANLGDDADTVAAVTGQLAGALWGEGGIPAEWRGRVAWGEEIAMLARALYTAGLSGEGPH
jgi:ADP-ribosyl-[dinitrogen reductase] hydrolase